MNKYSVPHDFWGVPFDEYLEVYKEIVGWEDEEECEHEFINVGFMNLQYVCKHCDKESEDY